jgi:hypothetical protein
VSKKFKIENIRALHYDIQKIKLDKIKVRFIGANNILFRKLQETKKLKKS